VRAIATSSAIGAVALSALLGAVRMLPACGTSFEPPCRVVERRALGAGAAAVLSEGTFGSEGDVVAVSLVPAAPPDAGAPEGGVTDGGAPSFFAPGALVTVFSAEGALRASHSFAPPSALRARHGSTAAVAVVFTGDGVFFRWTERSITTSSDGVATSRTAIVLQHVGLDGSEGARMDVPELTCSDCAIDVTSAAVGGTVALLASITPDHTMTTSPRRVLLLGLAADGHELGALDLSGLAGPERVVDVSTLGGVSGAAAAAPSRIGVQRGLFVARVGEHAAVFDGSLALRSGPHDIRTPEAEIDVEPATGNLVVVYSASAVPDATPTAVVGEAPDLIYEWRAPGGRLPFASRRISASTTALDVRRSGGRTGVVHLAYLERFFSLVAEDGTKQGGDLSLGESGSSSLLAPADATHFVAWSASNEVVREVIACDP
jgi:hypothetical protein